MKLITKCLILLLAILLTHLPFGANSQDSSKAKSSNVVNTETTVSTPSDLGNILRGISELKQELKDERLATSEKIEKAVDSLERRINTYMIIFGIALTFIGFLINFFGKNAIKKRVEEIIAETATKRADLEVQKILSTKITDGYIGNIISQMGLPEINKLLETLETRGKQVIEDIQSKGDSVINSVLASPQKQSTELGILPTEKEIKAEEVFTLAMEAKDPLIRIKLYKDVIEMEPHNAPAYNNLGVALNDTYQYEQAIEMLSKGITLAPQFALLYSNRANSYNLLNMFEDSLIDADKAISLDPKQEWPYAIKGNVLTKQKKFMEAERILDKAIAINPKSAVAFFHRGFFMEETKRYTNSEQDYIKAKENGFPNLGMLYNNLAVLERRKKNFEKAIEYIELARIESPHWGNIDGTLALIYADKNEPENFYKYLTIALEKGCPVWLYLDDDAFDDLRNQSRLKKLIEVYQNKYK